MDQKICTVCGKPFTIPPGGEDITTCLPCREAEFVAAVTQEKAPESAPRTGGRHRFRFTGSAGEYFRIWLVNTGLTLVTLGFYLPWAKVRSRRYLHANTLLAGHAFDYRANPIALLRGQLIVTVALGIYFASRHLFPSLVPILLVVGALAFPWLAYKSLRFKAHNSAWRSLRFRFTGTLGGSYKAFLLTPLLVGLPLVLFVGASAALAWGVRDPKLINEQMEPYALQLGLLMLFAMLWGAALFPLFPQRKYAYSYGHMGFGRDINRLRLRLSPFYGIYLKSGLLSMGLFVLLGIFMAISIGVSGGLHAGSVGSGMLLLQPVILFLGLLLVQSVQQYIYASETNLCFNGSQLGPVRFHSSLNGWELGWIRATNILAILGSLGLLAPWAKIRRIRYLLDRLELEAEELDGFIAVETQEDSATGDAALDALDFDFGF